MDRRSHQRIVEHQLVAGAGTRGQVPDSFPSSMASAFQSALPRHGQLLVQASRIRSGRRKVPMAAWTLFR
ncbi:hypothetical protein BC342_03770 [Streptomyces olivaceus]|nr:hypothetical protein BC342_03770 [Streptomyces olivaceus]